ncbi:MAG: HNH endonuclease signature motif containing protein [Pseudomonadota bacterium]
MSSTDTLGGDKPTTAAISPIDRARSFVRDTVQAPALASELPAQLKNKVRNSDVWLSKFRRIGDLLAYLKRFDAQDNDPVYRQLREHGLSTFEDIVDVVEIKFSHWANDCTRISDFIIGQKYSAYDILIFARNYDTRSGGMFVLEANGHPALVIIKATLSGGRYSNAWIEEPSKLKYYLKSINGKFGEHYKANAAIINTQNLGIATFVRNSDKDLFEFKGLFKYDGILTDEDGSKSFILTLNSTHSTENVADLTYVDEELAKSTNTALATPRESRLARLQNAPKQPKKILAISTVYDRNPDVIAEVLFRAAGKCERCHELAPFLSRASGKPYLEVHHRLQLARGGEDTVENAIALCPNCHRELHYGLIDTSDPDPIHTLEGFIE